MSAKNKTKTNLKPPPGSKEQLREVDRAFINHVMFSAGIIPMEDTSIDVRIPLKQLSAEDARVIKRKFRKLWRKALREDNSHLTQSMRDIQKRKLGVGKHVPSRAERHARKQLVYNMLWNTVIAPMLVKFENPERENKVQEEK